MPSAAEIAWDRAEIIRGFMESWSGKDDFDIVAAHQEGIVTKFIRQDRKYVPIWPGI